jgi:5-oxoprolinase (ATP-hydrolysing) subunit A
MKLDLNCDLGEGEVSTRTRALMRWITSANVACGGHAGNLATMKACVAMASQYCVRLGAHPGPLSRGDFGRTPVKLTPDEMELLLIQQVGALERLARVEGVKLHHVKLHGALYHASETDGAVARRYIETVKRWWPGLKIYAKAGGRVAAMARRAGVTVWEEAYIDRGYRNDGKLVPRGERGALWTDIDSVVGRVCLLLAEGVIAAESGQRLKCRPRSLCVHSDTPNAAFLARAVARLLHRCER